MNHAIDNYNSNYWKLGDAETSDDEIQKEIQKEIQHPNKQNIFYKGIIHCEGSQYVIAADPRYEVMVCLTTGYINISHLCNQTGKILFQWANNLRTKHVIQMMDDKIGYDTLFYVHGSSARGAYIHLMLLPYFFQWVSSCFEAYHIYPIIETCYYLKAALKKERHVRKIVDGFFA